MRRYLLSLYKLLIYIIHIQKIYITYIPNDIERGSDDPDTSVNLIKLHRIDPNHIKQNAVMAKIAVSSPRDALFIGRGVQEDRLVNKNDTQGMLYSHNICWGRPIHMCVIYNKN